MGGSFGEVRVLVKREGVSPDTSLTLRVQGREVLSTMVDPVTDFEVASMSRGGKIRLAIQYAKEIRRRQPARNEPTLQWDPKINLLEDPRETLRKLHDAVKEGLGLVHEVIEKVVRTAVGTVPGVGIFLASCESATDVAALREAGATLAKEASWAVPVLEKAASKLPE